MYLNRELERISFGLRTIKKTILKNKYCDFTFESNTKKSGTTLLIMII